MDCSAVSLTLSIGAEADVRRSADPAYPSVSIDDYTGTGYVTTGITLPGDPAARARIAQRLAQAFTAIHVAAASLVVERAVAAALEAHEALGHDTGCGCLDALELVADDARAAAHVAEPEAVPS